MIIMNGLGITNKFDIDSAGLGLRVAC